MPSLRGVKNNEILVVVPYASKEIRNGEIAESTALACCTLHPFDKNALSILETCQPITMQQKLPKSREKEKENKNGSKYTNGSNSNIK